VPGPHLHLRISPGTKQPPFPVMECADRELLHRWTACWQDLIEFEVIPVVTSAQAIVAIGLENLPIVMALQSTASRFKLSWSVSLLTS